MCVRCSKPPSVTPDRLLARTDWEHHAGRGIDGRPGTALPGPDLRGVCGGLHPPMWPTTRLNQKDGSHAPAADQPSIPESFWSSKWALAEVLPNKRTTNPPLGLATLAALCPPHWEVQIVDENIEPIPLEPQADIVGVCGMGVQFPASAGVARPPSQPRPLCGRRRQLRVAVPGTIHHPAPTPSPPGNPNTSGRSSAATSRHGSSQTTIPRDR